MESSDRRDLGVAAALWPLAMVLLLIAAFAPVGDELQLQSVFEEIDRSWPGGLSVAAILLAILLGYATSSLVVLLCVWACLFLAVWVGLAFNLGEYEQGAIGLGVLVGLLLVARIWIAWNVARKERKKRSTSPVAVTDDALLKLYEQVDQEIDLRRSRGAPRAEIAQLEDVRDQIEERLRQSI